MIRSLGDAARVPLSAQAPLLDALQVLQLGGCGGMGSMATAPGTGRGSCRRRRRRSGCGSTTGIVLVLLRLVMMMVVVQRSARPIVSDLLRQGLAATAQRRTQVVGYLRLGQQLLEHLQTKQKELSMVY